MPLYLESKEEMQVSYIIRFHHNLNNSADLFDKKFPENQIIHYTNEVHEMLDRSKYFYTNFR